MKEDIPESKKRTKVREVLSNSVCMETTDYMKAENDERWDQFGVELKKKKRKSITSSIDMNVFYERNDRVCMKML